ncbi:hypothetical protein I5Q34_13235 [Streptomyces sp. AV19]|uniref:hypothetical protein n=1 Tax=Streptomyces sp. AV19 TaxID=2793068 RepID=UPI0018FE076E|nr:hypothetical protein [Streptomyces sp. AV19]MBH1935227.1 hypothetical protein [Streptomyces sp. AV19]MDG4531128.1 hypothetical protein [Streptomyces sp. AV19]
MGTVYQSECSNAERKVWYSGIGYVPGNDDSIVIATRQDIERYTRDPQGTPRFWELSEGAERPEDRAVFLGLYRSFIYQEARILAVLRELNKQAQELRTTLKPEVFRRHEAMLDKEERQEFPKASKAIGEQFLEDSLHGPHYIDELERDPLYAGKNLFGAAAEAGKEAYQLGRQEIEDLIRSRQLPLIRVNELYQDKGQQVRSHAVKINRILDPGDYTAQQIPEDALRDMVNALRTVQREYQFHADLTWAEERRLVQYRQDQFDYARAEEARKAAESKGKGWLGILGDILGVVSAVAGALAFIPVLTPLAGPIALATAAGSLAAHAGDHALRGDWDKPGTWVELGTDMLGVIPGVKAVATGVRTASTTMRAVGTAGKVTIAARAGSKAFLAAAGGKAASEASPAFQYLGKQAARLGKNVGAKGAANIARALEGSTNLLLQVPTVMDLVDGEDDNDVDAAGGLDLLSSGAQTVGDWGAVRRVLKKPTASFSLKTFAKALA